MSYTEKINSIYNHLKKEGVVKNSTGFSKLCWGTEEGDGRGGRANKLLSGEANVTLQIVVNLKDRAGVNPAYVLGRSKQMFLPKC